MVDWSRKLSLKVLFQGWCSTLMLIAHREALSKETQHMKVRLDHQSAIADSVVERIRRFKEKKVRCDRRCFVASMVAEAVVAARVGDWKIVYARIRKLRPSKAFAFPMLKDKDGFPCITS